MADRRSERDIQTHTPCLLDRTDGRSPVRERHTDTHSLPTRPHRLRSGHKNVCLWQLLHAPPFLEGAHAQAGHTHITWIWRYCCCTVCSWVPHLHGTFPMPRTGANPHVDDHGETDIGHTRPISCLLGMVHTRMRAKKTTVDLIKACSTVSLFLTWLQVV